MAASVCADMFHFKTAGRNAADLMVNLQHTVTFADSMLPAYCMNKILNSCMVGEDTCCLAQAQNPGKPSADCTLLTKGYKSQTCQHPGSSNEEKSQPTQPGYIASLTRLNGPCDLDSHPNVGKA